MSASLNSTLAKSSPADLEPLHKTASTQVAAYEPAPDDAAKGKALINLLMQDTFFLSLLRSNDPKVRACAIDKLNMAHSQAYGEAGKKERTRR